MYPVVAFFALGIALIAGAYALAVWISAAMDADDDPRSRFVAPAQRAQAQLAEVSGVSVSTIRDFETAKRTPIGNNLAAIRTALEAAGVIFVEENGEGPGVRLRKTPP